MFSSSLRLVQKYAQFIMNSTVQIRYIQLVHTPPEKDAAPLFGNKQPDFTKFGSFNSPDARFGTTNILRPTRR